jgi:malate dehydrogenase
MRNKISIIGAGFVGSTTAHWVAEKEIGDIVLLDIPATDTMPKGKALDLLEAGPVLGYDTHIVGTTDYKDTTDSDIVVITAGLPRKPGMTREDLVGKNQAIITDVVNNIVKTSPNAILIIVTNPLDTMAYLAHKVSGLPRNRVIGQAGVLDSARMRTFMAQELNVSVQNTHAFVLGGHGDEMVPLVRYSTVAGIPITEWMSAERVNAIVKDRKLILPCAAYLDGEYGLKDMYFGVPVKLGRNGIEEIVQIKLLPEEQVMLNKSAELVRGTMSALKF